MLFKRQHLVAILATIALGSLTTAYPDPANAQNSQGNVPGNSQNNGCIPSRRQPKKCQSVPTPALLPALMLLGGGTLLYKRWKQQNQADTNEQYI
jgi:hypothetical protein